MNVFGFLKLRLEFIMQLHERSCAPFVQIKQQIEDEVPPYDPPYSEDGEPPYLAEWLEADESLQVLGYSCITMLAASLQLFFKTWETELRKPAMPQYKTVFTKKGWLNGYRQYFSDTLGIDFAKSPIPLIRLEEIVRARNVVQHPNNIASNKVSFTDDDLDVLQEPFLSSEIDRRMSLSFSDTSRWFLPLTLHVPPEKFEAALKDTAQFAAWLDEEIYDVMGWYPPKNRMAPDA
jgi:hypothetical protein